jgi:hypothetical protein
LYAESADGVRWEKPKLGLFEFAGNKDNNLVLQPHADERYIDDINILDDAEDQEWPLKALFWDAATHDFSRDDWGYYLARSKDGIHWDRSPGLAVPHGIDRFTLPTRRVNGKWLMFTRDQDLQASMVRNGRSVWRYESDDLVHWSKGELVLQRDPEDPPYLQYYSLSALPYESVTLGELVWSYDAGRTWKRAPKRPAFLEPSGGGRAWDDTWVYLPSNPPIKSHGQLWFFFGGRSQAHTFPHPTHGAIGLAQLRIDGFASLRAVEAEGLIVTKPLTWPGGDLLINADCRRNITTHRSYCTGVVTVEVRDEHNRPIDGYAWADAEPIGTNTNSFEDSRAPVKWRGEKTADALAGRRIRLAFKLRDAHLYSFRAALQPASPL